MQTNRSSNSLVHGILKILTNLAQSFLTNGLVAWTNNDDSYRAVTGKLQPSVPSI